MTFFVLTKRLFIHDQQTSTVVVPILIGVATILINGYCNNFSVCSENSWQEFYLLGPY